MTDAITLPARLTRMGHIMHPVLRRLEDALSELPCPTEPVLIMLDTIRNTLNGLGDAISRLTDATNALMSDVVANEQAEDPDIYRAVWRFDQALQEIVRSFRKINRLSAVGSDSVARDLLAGACRHWLLEIREWLQDLVDTLSDPLAALHRKNLPTTGPVVIPLDLKLTSPPELGALQRWGESAAPSPGRGRGILNTVGDISLGFLIGHALWGGD